MLKFDCAEIAKKCAVESYLLVDCSKQEPFVQYVSSQKNALIQIAIVASKYEVYQLLIDAQREPYLQGVPLETVSDVY